MTALASPPPQSEGAGRGVCGPVERSFDKRQVDAIRAILARSVYRDFDFGGVIDFYLRRYVKPLGAFVDIRADDTVSDIGTGYGWLAIAFALGSEARIVAIDADEARLGAARDIAQVLGLAARIDWRIGKLGRLPLGEREARVAYCIEVLEHTGCSRPAIRDLGRVTGEALVITTPNLFFPIVAHDTRLPFCHWLPLPLRARYARLCGRGDREKGNLFWSPRSLLRELPAFEVASRFLHFASRQEYLATFPIYVPYEGGGFRYADGRLKSAYYRIATLLGRHSLYVMPSLACTLRRRR